MVVKNVKVAIIGSGPAGYTAGIYLGRAGLEPMIIAGNITGGQLTNTTDVENFPGFDKISGFDLMDKMKAHAEKMGTLMEDDFISEVDFSDTPFILKGESGNEYRADAVIIATGAKARWLEIESEEKFKSRGISACATCDGFFYKGKKVAVVGGGSKALEEAIHLSNICAEVHLIHRRDEFRAERVLQKKVKESQKIIVHYDSVIEEFLGNDVSLKLSSVRLKNVKTGDFEILNVEGAFIAIGSTPNSGIFKKYIDTNEVGYIVTRNNCTLTNVEGVFCAGDVQDPIYAQAIVAAGSGCMAALDVQEYLMKKGK